MNRRCFIRRAGGLLVPVAFPFIAKAQVSLNNARLSNFQAVPAAGGGGCANTVAFNQDAGGVRDDNNAFDSYVYLAGDFTPASSFTTCRVDFWLFRNASVAGNLQAFIYSDSSGSPGSLVGSGSATATCNSVTTTADGQPYQSFITLSAASVSGVKQWVVLKIDANSGNMFWFLKNGSHNLKGSTNGSAWDTLRTANTINPAFSVFQ